MSQYDLPRAVAVVDDAAGDAACDTLLLDHEQRRSTRGIVTGLRGTAIEIALPNGQRCRAGDRLRLDDGRLVEIVARPEPLLEVRAGDTANLARLAWLLGDHHIQVEIHPRRLRLLRSQMARTLLEAQNARVIEIEAPFEPEGGAYDAHVHD